MKEQSDVHPALTPFDEAAERIRAIATRAAAEYRRKNLPVPDYVEAAMQTGFDSAAPKAKPAKQSRGQAASAPV